MANRVVRNWTHSDRINNLSEGAEIFFIRLIMTVDDYGCFHANPKLLLASCFPLKNYTTNDIGDWLTECKQQELLVTYLVEKKLYLQILDFKQVLRRPKHKFPTSDGQVTDNDGQVTAEKKRNRNESESEIEKKDKIFSWFEKILLEQTLAENFCQLAFVEITDFVPAVENFFAKNQTVGNWESYNDFKKHFLNWCPRWPEYKKQNNGNKQSTFKNATGFRSDNPFLKEFIERKRFENMDSGSQT